jgi:hypothetical protein
MKKSKIKISGKAIHDGLERLKESRKGIKEPEPIVEFTTIQIELLREHFDSKKTISRFMDYVEDGKTHTILLH